MAADWAGMQCGGGCEVDQKQKPAVFSRHCSSKVIFFFFFKQFLCFLHKHLMMYVRNTTSAIFVTAFSDEEFKVFLFSNILKDTDSPQHFFLIYCLKHVE